VRNAFNLPGKHLLNQRINETRFPLLFLSIDDFPEIWYTPQYPDHFFEDDKKDILYIQKLQVEKKEKKVYDFIKIFSQLELFFSPSQLK
jgi:hypothetical protein